MQITASREISLDEVFDSGNIELAFKHLKTKQNSCGIDGIELSDLGEYWKANGDNIIALAAEKKYEPGIVLIKEIVQPNGKRRDG